MCPLMHHICLSPITGNLTCLHIDRVNDGVNDCLGSTDEQFCRRKCTISDECYRCWNSTECIKSLYVCPPLSKCSTTSDISMSFCQDMPKMDLRTCRYSWTTHRVQDFLCKLTIAEKLHIKHLSLSIPKYYSFTPKTNSGKL